MGHGSENCGNNTYCCTDKSVALAQSLQMVGKAELDVPTIQCIYVVLAMCLAKGGGGYLCA